MISLPNVTVKRKIYDSSTSLVYRAIRELDSLAVILKVLKQDYPAVSELVRYKQEYEIIRSLNLEGVITVYAQQEYQRTIVMLLEDFGGESLEYWMHQQPDFSPMPLSTFLRLAIDITAILGRIHAAHVIHKDINPSNIVLNLETGVVKIIDFGIATRFSRTNSTFKNPYGLEGTLAYVSPEQTGRMNRAMDYRTDFYSLGATFYQLLTGQLPFPTPDILELVHSHIAKQPTPPHELNEAIPESVSTMILKLMAKNAEDRYQSAWGIKADLERCAEQLASGQMSCLQLGLRDVSDQFHIPQKLYGREAEIATLLVAFERVAGKRDNTTIARRGDAERDKIPVSAEMMLVSGYSGVGKSALVQELYKPITAKRGYFISGKFDQFQRNIPYSAIVDALRKLMQQLLGEPDGQVQRWQSRLLSALGSNGQLIIDVIPEVEWIIGKQPPVPEVGSTESQNRFNLVFQQFIQVFCSKEHPLVIFLDDLQWIDSTTLKLIELMLRDEQTQFLFLIGAYRDNEVSPSHPLVLMLERLRKQGVVLSQIVLSPLTLEPLSRLIAEAIHRDIHTVLPLAEFVLRKTGGNPFFVGEFLRLLHSDHLVYFDTDRLSWRWDLDQIRALNITNNVVELLLNKLKKLPEVSQQLLRLAACIGSEFDLETLAIVCDQSPKAVFQGLIAVIQAGLIQPLSELDEDLLVQDYKFLHDRFQQAAYALIDESQKQIVHLQIGRNLLKRTPPEQRSDQLFEIVDHLNQGTELITVQLERIDLARLNLMAGQKAKAATAYEAALKYFATGLKFLDSESWECVYDLTLSLHSGAAGAAYLHGCFAEMERFAAVVLDRAKTVLDKVQVYDSRIQGYLSQGNLKEGLKIGLEALNFLGVTLVENPSQPEVQRELAETAARLAGREIEGLINLPEMTAPEQIAAMSILTNMEAAAFMVSPALMTLISCKKVNLSIEYGHTIWSPDTYVSYGFVLCGVVHDIELGYQFVKLALSLAKQSNTQKGKAKALAVSSAHIMPWKVHVKEVIPLLMNAHQTGVETGDFEFAGYAAHQICHFSFFSGKELTQLEQKIVAYSKAIQQIRREIPSNWIAMLWQTVLNLSDGSENPSCLIGRVCNEEQALSYAIAVKDGSGVSYFYLYKMILCYLFGEYHQARQTALAAKQQLEEMTSIVVLPLFYFYYSLVLLSLFVEASSAEKADWLSCVNINRAKMQEYAKYAPMNYLHKYYLVEAETARVLGQLFEAEEFYERAIAGAAEHEFIQEEALAYELAAKHYLARGRKKFAQIYMQEAHYCYNRWGATAKVKDLEARYPQLFSQSHGGVSTAVHTAGTISNTSHTALDLATVMKAAQAISSEIELEQLLRSLMQILIENAGAQTGCLLLENAGEWAIEAACELNGGEQVCTTQVLKSISMVNRLSESIVQYVIRTHESVLLGNASREGNFINDPYIQQNQTRSLLCLPLLNQNKLVGVLYLENHLAIGAFTPERTQVLNLLSTQAAIAIEKAQLYSKLRASESRMTQFLEAIPVGISILDAAGRPYFLNQQAIQLTGKGVVPSTTLDQLADTYQVYVAGTDQKYPTEKMTLFRALRGERTRVDDSEIHRDGTIIPVEIWGTPVFDEQGNVAYAIAAFQDITERKQVERLLADYSHTLEQQVAERTLALEQEQAALRQSEATNRAIISAIPDLLIQMDQNGTYLKVVRSGNFQSINSQHLRVGATVHHVLPPEFAQIRMEYTQRALQSDELQVYEQTIVSDDQVYDQEVRIVPSGTGQVLVMIRNISDRKRAEEASILEERNRMAREIHDTLAQAFTGVLIHMGTVSRLVVTKPEAVQTHVDIVRELARNGLIEARRSVAALRPQLLEEGDLGTALEQFVLKMQSSTESCLTCQVIGTPYVMLADIENNLLRIAQEAFINAVKYAYASQIEIELIYEPTFCCLQIKDNGRGFEVNDTVLSRGFGLLGMTERSEHIGAQFSIESQLGQGTEISVSIQREPAR